MRGAAEHPARRLRRRARGRADLGRRSPTCCSDGTLRGGLSGARHGWRLPRLALAPSWSPERVVRSASTSSRVADIALRDACARGRPRPGPRAGDHRQVGVRAQAAENRSGPDAGRDGHRNPARTLRWTRLRGVGQAGQAGRSPRDHQGGRRQRGVYPTLPIARADRCHRAGRSHGPGSAGIRWRATSV